MANEPSTPTTTTRANAPTPPPSALDVRVTVGAVQITRNVESAGDPQDARDERCGVHRLERQAVDVQLSHDRVEVLDERTGTHHRLGRERRSTDEPDEQRAEARRCADQRETGGEELHVRLRRRVGGEVRNRRFCGRPLPHGLRFGCLFSRHVSVFVLARHHATIPSVRVKRWTYLRRRVRGISSVGVDWSGSREKDCVPNPATGGSREHRVKWPGHTGGSAPGHPFVRRSDPFLIGA